MTAYQFTLIECLVNNDISTTISPTPLLDLEQEKQRILREFPSILCLLEDPSRKKLFLQHHQHRLIQMMNQIALQLPDKMLGFTPPADEDPELRQYYDHLEDLLLFFECDYGHLLDLSLQVPVYHLLHAQVSIAPHVTKLSEAFIRANLSLDTWNVIMRPYLDLLVMKPDDYNLTYKKLNYLEELMKGLQMLFKSNRLHELGNLLIHLNFNMPEYYQHAVGIMEQDIAGIPDIQEKLDKVMLLHKYIDQQQVKSDYCFTHTDPPLKPQLLHWLDVEYRFLEYHKGPSGAASLQADMVQWQQFKIKTTLSVSQLAYLFGLLIEANVILNKDIKEISSFISTFFSSTRQQDIAIKSLRNKMYDTSGPVVDVITDVLYYMIKLSKKKGSQ
jgi:hypothetical protein